jgi:hypothetical protein
MLLGYVLLTRRRLYLHSWSPLFLYSQRIRVALNRVFQNLPIVIRVNVLLQVLVAAEAEPLPASAPLDVSEIDHCKLGSGRAYSRWER